MSETGQIVTYCITGVLLLGILIGGPVMCSISQQQEATKRMIATCSGDLKTDQTRAIACILAANAAKTAGNGQ